MDAASLNHFESLADFGTWLVIVGVAGEGFEILLKVLQHKLKREAFLTWCKKHDFLIEIFGAGFWLLVVIGLAVEFMYGHKAKTITDKENALLIQNAAELNLKSEVFRLKADSLERRIMETSNNIANADPRNQPLKSVTAVATILFSSSVLVSNQPTDSIISNAGMSLLQMKLFSKNTGYMVDLYANEPLPYPMEYLGNNGLPISNSISIHLSGDAAMRQPFEMQWNSLLLKTNLTAGQIAGLDFEVSLTPSFLRPGTVVFGGSVAVWFNSPNVEKDFSILPQQLSDWEYESLKCVPVASSSANPQK